MKIQGFISLIGSSSKVGFCEMTRVSINNDFQDVSISLCVNLFPAIQISEFQLQLSIII